MSTMKHRLQREYGFSLIELTIVIVVIGILAAVAMRSMTALVQDSRKVKTKREMEMLACAIVGDPSATTGGVRSDFGYICDIGAFPPNLQALYQNPGSYSTWDGPYLLPGFSQDSTGFKTDEWGTLYNYSGGITITSTGSGSTITKKIADATSDYLLNAVLGNIKDANDSLPGATYMDSVDISITIPNGSGGMITKIYHPDSTGVFTLDSLPVGTHPLRIIYTPEVDTVFRYLTVLPRHKSNLTYKFSSSHFSTGLITIGEVGQVVRDQTTGGDWYTVNLNNTYSDPVVVMRGLSYNGSDPTHLRVRNVTSTSFEWQMEEWDYCDGPHTTETCPYMVIESGVYTLEDGTIIQAGLDSSTHTWTSITFSQAFSSTPCLITGVASQNDAAACITRSRSLSSTGFQIKVQEEEAGGAHGKEQVAWIAIEPGSGTNNSVAFLAGQTSNSVTHNWYTIPFSPAFSQAPIFLCHDDTYDGGNTCGTRFRNLGASLVQVMIEEEKSNDSEINHTTERVSYVAWGLAGNIVAQ